MIDTARNLKTTCHFFGISISFSVFLLNNIDAQMMYNPKIEGCSTILQKRSK